MASCLCGFSGGIVCSSRRQFILAIFVVLLALNALAQQPSPTANTNPQMPSTAATPAQGAARLMVPAGTHLPMVLTHPVNSKVMHRGDQVYAQITAPVTLDTRVVIPPGTFVQGRIEKLTRRQSRGEILLQSVSLVFPDGYVAEVQGPITIESGEGTAFLNPSGGRSAGAIAAPLAGVGLGALIGSAAHTTDTHTLGDTTLTSNSPKGVAIGSLVGGAAGGVVSVVLLMRSRDFYIDVGSPMEMILSQPLAVPE